MPQTGTRRVLIGCAFAHAADADTPAVFQVQPLESPSCLVQHERWDSNPEQPTRGYRDLYGNRCARATIPAGRSVLSYEAVVEVSDAPAAVDLDAPEVAPDALPDDVLLFTLPSRYCLPDVLGEEARSRFGSLRPGYRRVQAICAEVSSQLRSRPTDGSAVAEASASGYEVARDSAHLTISLCRALHLPARYVFGYLPDLDAPPAGQATGFAVWTEVWLGDRWWTFDPRNGETPGSRIAVGRGRDAADVAMATTFGSPLLESMLVRAEEVTDRV